MLPLVKLERLEMFSCGECSFVSHNKLATEYHKIATHCKALQLGYESETSMNEDRYLMASDEGSERKSRTKQDSVVSKKRGRPPKSTLKAKTLECAFCDEDFERKVLLKDHLKQLHVQEFRAVAEPSPVQCCVCALKFDKRPVLALHLRMVHSLSAEEAQGVVNEQLGQVGPGPEHPTASPCDEEIIILKTENFDKSLDEDNPDPGDAPNYEDYLSDDSLAPEDEEVNLKEPSVMDNAAAAAGLRKTGKSAKRPSKQRRQKKSQTLNSCQICNVALEGTIPDAEGHYKNWHHRSTECFLCLKAFSVIGSLRQHLYFAHGLQVRKSPPPTKPRKPKRWRAKCPECDKEFGGVFLLARHLRIDHRATQLDLPCSLCDQRFSSARDHKRHSVEHKRPPTDLVDCHVCKGSFKGKECLRRHLLKAHPDGDNRIVCWFCPSTFVTEVEFKEHCAYNHDNPSKCIVCGVEYPLKRLLLHYKYHTAEISRQCDACEKIFADRRSLRVHRQRVHVERQLFCCDKCGKTFMDSWSVKHHNRAAHGGGITFDCHHCGKKFSRKDLRQAHIDSVHLKLKKFKCEKCDAEYGSNQQLKTHVLVHHEGKSPAVKPKKFSCEICGQAFAFQSNVTNHRKRVHDGLRFNCPHCGKEFGTKPSMNRHVETIHQKIKPYVCPVCKQSFGTKHSMGRHTKTHHGTESTPPTEKS